MLEVEYSNKRMDLKKLPPWINKKNFSKLGFLFLSIAISVVILLNKGIFSNLQGYGYLGIFLLSLLGNSTVIIPAPVILTALVGGGLYNPYAVGLTTAAGAAIGELTGYMAGVGGTAFVKEGKAYRKIKGWMEKNGFLTLFVLAVIPNPLFDAAGISAGVMNYPVKRFLVATFLGKSIKFIVVALIGANAF